MVRASLAAMITQAGQRGEQKPAVRRDDGGGMNCSTRHA
jgi:hypothetical protein